MKSHIDNYNIGGVRYNSVGNMFDSRLLKRALSTSLPLTATILFGALGSVLIVLQARLLSQVIADVFLGYRTLGEVGSVLFKVVFIIILRSVFSWSGEVAANHLAVRVKTVLRQQLFEKILGLGPAYVRGEKTGELVNTLTEGVEALDAYFREYLPQLAMAVIIPVTILVVVFPLDWISGIIFLVTAPLIPFFMILIGGLAEGLTQRQWQTLSRMSGYFLEMLQGLTTLKVFGRSRLQAEVIARVSDQYHRITLNVLRIAFLSALALELLSTLSVALVAVGIGVRLLYGKLVFSDALFVLFIAPDYYLPLRMLATRFHAGVAGVNAAGRIFEILASGLNNASDTATKALEVEVSFPDQAGETTIESSLPISEITHVPCLQFEHIHYTYPAGERAALEDVCFTIQPGEKVALVGPSGAGKSTLAAILLAFIQPTQGWLLIDGYPLSEIQPAIWRARVAYLPQNPYLFNDTVLENIRLADSQASLEKVIEAAKKAQAHEFIQSLADGYDTVIGERGLRLSGGQAQRIALARAFLKDAPILILDEATANLDPQLEAQIQSSLEQIMVGKSVLIIAHRLATVRRCDRIVVLDRGRIVQTGTHLTLMQEEGLYRRLIESYHGGTEVEAPVYELAPEPLGLPVHLPVVEDTKSRGTGEFRLLGFISPHLGLVTLSILLGFAAVCSGIGLMTLSAYIISMAALQPSIAVLQVPIVGVRFFGVARGVFRYLERLISHTVTLRILTRLRVWFYRGLEPLAPARLMQYRSGDLFTRIMVDIATLENFYPRAVAPSLVAILVLGASITLLAFFDVYLALILLVFWMMAALALPFLMASLTHRPSRRWIAARGALNALLVDCIQGLAELLVFKGEKNLYVQLKNSVQRFNVAQTRLAYLKALQGTLASLLSQLGMLSVLVWAIILIGNGRLEGVYLATITLAALSSFEAALPLPLAAYYLETSRAAFRRLSEILDARPEVVDPPEPEALPAGYHIEARGLSFAYPGQASGDKVQFALEDITFVLPQGRSLAIVGPNGSGKTTLINLILRFWEYQHGDIRLGGKSLKCYAQDDLRRIMGVVTQKTTLFNASIRNNLLIARPDASEEALIQVARQAQIDDFIQSLPQGYDTFIGEGGVRLSAGERQRLAIARALLKDAPILILDEATANLDAVTEQKVLQALQGLMANRTTLIVTHRLVNLEAVDEILVLYSGRVIQRGTHRHLLQSAGLYRRMWELQSQVL